MKRPYPCWGMANDKDELIFFHELMSGWIKQMELFARIWYFLCFPESFPYINSDGWTQKLNRKKARRGGRKPKSSSFSFSIFIFRYLLQHCSVFVWFLSVCLNLFYSKGILLVERQPRCFSSCPFSQSEFPLTGSSALRKRMNRFSRN